MSNRTQTRRTGKRRALEMSPSEIVRDLLFEKVTVTNRGVREQRRTIDLINDALIAKAIKGDIRAFRFLRKYMQLHVPEVIEIHVKGFMKGYAEMSREADRRKELGLLPDWGDDE